jgi:hypothetical protein
LGANYERESESLAKIGSLLKRYRIRSVTPEAVREALVASMSV